MAEIPFEYLTFALETTRGTAITAPTHYAPIQGMMTPKMSRFRPAEARGMLAEFFRSQVVRQWAEWEGEGPLDNFILPLFLEMLVKGGISPTTPSGATTTRLWTYTPSMTADNIKTATAWWGDPNTQIFRSPFAYVDELTLSADASSEDGATMSVKGMAQFPSKVSAPTLPSQIVGPMIAPADMQVFLDTSSAIGTTALTGRVVSAEFTLPNAVVPKYLASGPGGSRTYQRIGRKKRHMEAKIKLELIDMNEYDIFTAGTTVKLRVQLNGPKIETVTGPTDLYHYVEVDIYGPLDELSWDGYEDTNRLVEFTIQSEYDATLGADFSIKVQNTRATL